MVVAVGYAMVIYMMATREVWPFFAIVLLLLLLAVYLIAFGTIGVVPHIHINLTKRWRYRWNATSNIIGDILRRLLEGDNHG